MSVQTTDSRGPLSLVN